MELQKYRDMRKTINWEQNIQLLKQPTSYFIVLTTVLLVALVFFAVNNYVNTFPKGLLNLTTNSTYLTMLSTNSTFLASQVASMEQMQWTVTYIASIFILFGVVIFLVFLILSITRLSKSEVKDMEKKIIIKLKKEGFSEKDIKDYSEENKWQKYHLMD